MGITTQTYDILTRIAIGNGALVYRAVEKTSLRQVALKLLTQDGEIDHRFDLEALFADAPRLKSIYGAHVCQLLDAYSDDDGPVLVYEFANGLNGAEFPTQRKLEPVQALDVAAQLISALRSGERQRTPHCDLKPSNLIFVDLPEGRPFTFVLDWGLAGYRSALSDDSLAYLAPERLRGAPPSHLADLFSAGAVLFYLYTGKVLVAGGSQEAVAAAWPKVRPSVLAELRPDLPPKLVQWVCSLLEYDPAKRPPTAVEASAMLAALGPPPPVAPPESIRPRPVSAIQAAPRVASAPASSVVPPPLRSGVRPAPVANTPSPRPIPRPVAPPKKSVLPSVLLGAMVAAALGGGGWYIVQSRNKTSVEEPALADNKPARTPSPSVTAPVPQAPPRPLPNSVEPVRDAKAAKPGATKAPTPVEMASKPPAAERSTAPPAPAPEANAPGGEEDGFVAEESFSYGGGSQLAGLSGGSGWAGPWQGPPAATEVASLSYSNHPTTGGSLAVGDAGEEQVWTRVLGPASKVIRKPEKGGHWYFGALIDHRSVLPTPGGEIQINPCNTEDIYKLFRIVLTKGAGMTKVTLNTEKNGTEVKDDGKPICLVMRVEARNPRFDNFDYVAKLWVNPSFTGKVPPANPTLQLEIKQQPLPKQFGVMIRKKRGQMATKLDEIRYALHWKSMAFQKEGDDND